MTIPLANYDKEHQLFQELIADSPSHRILMFHADSGMGKSRLFQACIETTPAHVRYVSVQLRGVDTTVSHVMLRLGNRVRWSNLPTLLRQVAKQIGRPDAYQESEWREGMRQHLQTALLVESVEERRRRRGLLTDAPFRDVRQFEQPFLLALDTYEQANTEVDHWLSQQLLPWVADTRYLRVLMMGQTVPELSADWQACCGRYELKGVREAAAWLPVAEAMGYDVPSLDYLAGVCAAFKGSPRQILQFIQTLPRRQMLPIKPDIDLKRVREHLDKKFSRDELDDLCFELDIEIGYEELAGDTHRAKALSLLRYMERRERLPELVSKGRELRPNLDW